MQKLDTEPGSLADMVIYLDCALTGKDYKTALHTARNQARLLINGGSFAGMDDAYYLSDGGYSRLCWDLSECKLFLSSVSRQEVKDAWQRCKELISDIEIKVGTT